MSVIAEARQSRGQMAIDSFGLKYFKAFQHKGNCRLRTFPQIDKEPRCHSWSIIQGQSKNPNSFSQYQYIFNKLSYSDWQAEGYRKGTFDGWVGDSTRGFLKHFD